MAQLRKTKNEKWQEFVIDFIFANYDFEYFNPQREAYFNDQICNQIIFPVDTNGILASKVKLENMVNAILADDALSEKIFGPGVTTVEVVKAKDFHIIWNNIPVSVYDQLDNEKLDALYRY